MADSWWIGPKPDGFTAYAAMQMKVVVPVDDVSDREVQIIAHRQHVLSVLIGLGKAKQTFGLRHANVVSRN